MQVQGLRDTRISLISPSSTDVASAELCPSPPTPLPETLKLLQTLGAPRLFSERGEQDISARESLDDVDWRNERFHPGPTDEEQNLRPKKRSNNKLLTPQPNAQRTQQVWRPILHKVQGTH